MLKFIRPAAALVGLFTLLTGLVYPLALTAVTQVLMPSPANGSLLVRNGRVIGSALIGQQFTSGKYFHPRPSAAGKDGYDAAASSGSNLGPVSGKLMERVKADAAALRSSGATWIPVDAVTASASGLDPHISLGFAQLQVARIATARGVDAVRIHDIVTRQIVLPVGGFAGEPLVNVLLLNLALDEALMPVSE
ncbi:MAG: potassium-transporting ATPase subunit KdpC [Hyphomicrobium sp.]|nr:potassium-transporting ATPase subunit KdpC [Hyphomicrobium sp.]